MAYFSTIGEKRSNRLSVMEKYINYKLEDFLLDDSFSDWVDAGAVVEGSEWGLLIQRYPEKKYILERAILIVKEWKSQPSALSDDQLYRNIDAILEAADRSETRTRLLRPRWMGYAAAVFLALCVTGYLLLNRPFEEEKTWASELKNRQVEIFNAEKTDKTITLPDGSQVRLSPGSQVAYARSFGEDKMRNIDLIGEAFFDVKRDTLRPFSVYSGGITTRVLGTSFTVRAGAKDVSVTVNTGKVSVSRSGRESDPMVLTPNQKAVYVASAQTLTKTLAEVPVIVFQEELKGRFAFDGEPAGSIFKALEKAYGIPIHFDETALKECFVTLPFREEPFYQKLDILCRTINASYKVTDDGVIIQSGGCE